jgi:hypothetical protein
VTAAIAVTAIVMGVQAGRTGSFDPSLASRMGSDALKFPIQLAYVLAASKGMLPAGLLPAFGFIDESKRLNSVEGYSWRAIGMKVASAIMPRANGIGCSNPIPAAATRPNAIQSVS